MKLTIGLTILIALFSFWVYMMAKRWIIPLVVLSIAALVFIGYIVNGGAL